MKKTTILIVGEKGQLGRDCLSVLADKGTVIGVDLPELDITDGEKTASFLDHVAPDVIVNCAAYTAVDACETDPTCWDVNAEGPKHLAKWAFEHGAFLVHVSTDYVFSGDKPLFEPCFELDKPAPVSEYGRSKLGGEQAISESGAEAAILRTAWLYGQNGKNFLKTILRFALQDPARALRVVNDQFGSPTCSHTLARQIAAVMEARATGIFHATSEGYCSWYDFADHFLTRLGHSNRVVGCTSDEYPTPARRPENSILENQRLKEAGINVFCDWEEELDSFLDASGEWVINEVKELI